MHIGLTELVLIVIVAFACIKPDKLIDYAGKLGHAVRSLVDEQKKLSESVDVIVQPIKEIKNEVNDVLTDVSKDVKGDD